MITADAIIDQLAGMTIQTATETLEAAIKMLQTTQIVAPIDLTLFQTNESVHLRSPANDEHDHSSS